VQLVSAEVVGNACPRCGALLVVDGTAELARLRERERRAQPSPEIEWKTCLGCAYRSAKRLRTERRY